MPHKARQQGQLLSKHLAAGVLVDGDRVLLVKRSAKRSYFPDVWDFAGGHSEQGEAPEETLARELAEELGVIPIEYSLLGVVPRTAEGLPLYAYCVTKWMGTPANLQEHEHSEIAWIPASEVDRLDLASPVIPSLLQSIRLSD